MTESLLSGFCSTDIQERKEKDKNEKSKTPKTGTSILVSLLGF